MDAALFLTSPDQAMPRRSRPDLAAPDLASRCFRTLKRTPQHPLEDTGGEPPAPPIP